MRKVTIAFALAPVLTLGACERPPAPNEGNPLIPNTGCPPLPPISGFVGRDDGALLLDRVTPYRATGTNLYYLQQLLSYAQQDQDATALRTVREVLDDLVCLSLPVARIWGFNDSAKDASAIRHSPEEGFREEGLRGLDQAVWEAKRRGIRLIIPLVNNWGEYGGLPAYAAWASKAFGGTYDARRLLHQPADEAVVEGLRLHAREPGQHLHRHRLQGRARRSWPGRSATSCAARAAAAPPGCPTPSPSWRPSSSRSRPTSWSATAATASTTTRPPTSACRTSTPCAATRAPATRSWRDIEALDMLSYHFYPHNYGFSTARDTEIWIERHQAIASRHRQGRLPGRVRLRRAPTPSAPRATTAGCATCSRQRAGSSACSGSSRRPAASTTTASRSTRAATTPRPGFWRAGASRCNNQPHAAAQPGSAGAPRSRAGGTDRLAGRRQPHHRRGKRRGAVPPAPGPLPPGRLARCPPAAPGCCFFFWGWVGLGDGRVAAGAPGGGGGAAGRRPVAVPRRRGVGGAGRGGAGSCGWRWGATTGQPPWPPGG